MCNHQWTNKGNRRKRERNERIETQFERERKGNQQDHSNCPNQARTYSQDEQQDVGPRSKGPSQAE